MLYLNYFSIKKKRKPIFYVPVVVIVYIQENTLEEQDQEAKITVSHKLGLSVHLLIKHDIKKIIISFLSKIITVLASYNVNMRSL